MSNTDQWQSRLVRALDRQLYTDPDIRALVLVGSLADENADVDRWSDVDLLLVVAENAVERYFRSPAWLHPYGRVVGVERHRGEKSRTLRVCLTGGRRLDVVLIPDSLARELPPGDSPPSGLPHTVLWTREPNLADRLYPSPAAEAPAVSERELERRADRFWFQAVLAMTRVARNDYLIATHLALGLVQECLVLQMIRRDQIEGTSAHRTGGWGNDLVDGFAWDPGSPRPLRILELIRQSCETFDHLASRLSPGYAPRAPLVADVMDSALETCSSGEDARED